MEVEVGWIKQMEVWILVETNGLRGGGCWLYVDG